MVDFKVRPSVLGELLVLPSETVLLSDFSTAEIYISPSGSDSAAGTESDPLASITEAFRRSSEASTLELVFLAGTYTFSFGSPDFPSSFSPPPNVTQFTIGVSGPVVWSGGVSIYTAHRVGIFSWGPSSSLETGSVTVVASSLEAYGLQATFGSLSLRTIYSFIDDIMVINSTTITGSAVVSALTSAGNLNSRQSIVLLLSSPNFTGSLVEEAGVVLTDADDRVAKLSEVGSFESFSRSGELIVTNGKGRFTFPIPGIITGWSASVDTAPSGSSLDLRLNRNGASLDTGSIPDGTNVLTQRPLEQIVSATDYVTVDITAVGSSTPGEDLTVTMTWRPIS